MDDKGMEKGPERVEIAAKGSGGEAGQDAGKEVIVETARRPYTFDRVTRIIFTVIGVLSALYLIDVLHGVLLPFVVACLMAYMLEPIVKWNMRLTHLRQRFIPVVLTLVELIAAVAIFCWLFIPYMASEMTSMYAAISRIRSTTISATTSTSTRSLAGSRATNGSISPKRASGAPGHCSPHPSVF